MRKGYYAAGVFTGIVLIAAINAAHGQLLTPMIDHYGLSQSSQGLMSGSQSAGSVAAFVSSLWVMGRAPKSRLMAWGMAGAALLILPIAFAPPFWALIALFTLLGAALGYVDTLASSIIADLYDGKAKTRMLCVLHASFGVGGMIAPLVFRGMLASGEPWNRVFLAVALFALLMCLYVLPVNRRFAREETGSAASARVTKAIFGSFFADRTRLFLLAATVAYNVYLNTMQVWTPRYMELNFGSADLASLTLSLHFVGLTISRLATSLFAFPPIRYLRISTPLAGIVLAVGTLSGNSYLASASVGLCSLLSGAAIPMILDLISDRFPQNTLLATTSVFFCVYVTQAWCPPLIGAIAADAAGLRAAMLVAAVSIAACGALALCVKNTGKELA